MQVTTVHFIACLIHHSQGIDNYRVLGCKAFSLHSLRLCNRVPGWISKLEHNSAFCSHLIRK